MTSHSIVRIFVMLGLSGTAFAKDRKFTVINSCDEQICPGVTQADSPGKMAMPNGNNGPFGGFCLKAGGKEVLTLPDRWSGRIWGRSGCDASGKCLTGDCGGIDCQHGNEKPATLAEMTLAQEGDPKYQDHYDISLVDGFNIPASLRIEGDGCRESVCEGNANAHCPDELRAAINAEGVNMGCRSACEAGFGQAVLQGPQGEARGSMNCCSAGWAVPGSCPSDCIDYYSVMKDVCTTGYSYAYDENSQTALSTCKNQGDYTLTFCPTQKDFRGNAGGDTKYVGDLADQGKCAAVPLMPGFSITTPPTKVAGGGSGGGGNAPAPAASGSGTGSASRSASASASPSAQPAGGNTSVLPPAPVPSAQTTQVEVLPVSPAPAVTTTTQQRHEGPPRHTQPAAAVIIKVGESLASAPEPSLVKKCDENHSAEKRSARSHKKRKTRRSRQID